MSGLDGCRTVARDALPEAARVLRDDGWRFVTATAVPHVASWTVFYHFERSERLCHLRVDVPAGGSIPAIDEAFPAAFLVENEMSELQALVVTGLSVDYGGHLYRDLDGPEGWVHVHSPGAGETVRPIAPGRSRRR